MTAKVYRIWMLVQLLIIAGLLVTVCNLVLRSTSERIEMKQAWNLIVDYDRIRSQLGALNVQDTATYLEITVHTKLDGANHDLNNIKQRERAKMIQDLLVDLRKKTGDNLGSDPEKWINKYYRFDGNESSNQR